MTTISALVLVLEEDPKRRARALASLTLDPRIEVGVESGNRVAVVTEAVSAWEARDLFWAIERTEGVAFVYVVSADFGASADAPNAELN